MIRSKRSRLLALSLGAFMLATACTTGGDEDPEGSKTPDSAQEPGDDETDQPDATGDEILDETVTLALASPPSTMDPNLGTHVGDYIMARMVYDPLVRRDDGGEVSPGLAVEWSATPTSAEFTLADGITCSDGTPLTATDVANALNRFADPATGAGAASQVFGPGNEVTVIADDATNTVSIEMADPWSDLLAGLALPQAGIMCAAALDDQELAAAGGQGAGTGQYYVSDSQAGTNYTLTARDGYTWGPEYVEMPGGSIPRTIEMPVVAAESTMASMMQAGDLDYIGLTGPDAATFAENPDYGFEAVPLIRMMLVINNAEGHPGADPAVREAIAQAIDRTKFNDAITGGTAPLMNSIADPAVPCAIDDESLIATYDTAAAAEVLDGVDIHIKASNIIAGGVGNEYLRVALEEAGANVTLSNVDNATWGTDVIGNTGDWDITVLPNLNLTNLLTQPGSMMLGETPGNGGQNFASIDVPAYTEAFGEALAAVDEDAKCAAWATGQQALLESRSVLPMMAMNVHYITSSEVLIASPDNILSAETVRITG